MRTGVGRKREKQSEKAKMRKAKKAKKTRRGEWIGSSRRGVFV